MRKIPVGWLLIAIIVLLLGLGVGVSWQWSLDRQELAILRQLQQAHELIPVLATSGTPPASTSIGGTSDSRPKNPHASSVQQIETVAGMPLSRIARLIIREEGNKQRPYLDTTGAPTIGIGRNLKGNGLSVAELKAIQGEIDYELVLKETTVENGRVQIATLALAKKIFVKPLTEDDVHLLLVDDLKNVQDSVVSIFGKQLWGEIKDARKEALLDVMYNLGEPHFRKFEKLISAVKRKDWKTAASELLLSDAARKNIIRYHRNATVLRTGDEKYFDL